jgi:hypothetical protein
MTFRNLNVDESDMLLVTDYLLDILVMRDLTLQDKNRAYNIVAYLASLFGKKIIMARFEKLNTMLTISMEKIVDKKLLLMGWQNREKEEDIPTCEHCHMAKESFRDRNVYDLHCFKECKYITPCKYCGYGVEIPELNKNYIYSCQQRNIFKEC